MSNIAIDNRKNVIKYAVENGWASGIRDTQDLRNAARSGFLEAADLATNDAMGSMEMGLKVDCLLLLAIQIDLLNEPVLGIVKG